MYGFYNMALRVNVTQKAFDIQILPDHVTRKFLGGKGLAIHLLRQYNPAGVDPLSAGNPLLFAIGPVTGTGIRGSCRHGVFTKSPHTGGYAESYAGGGVAEAMARAGIDALMIDGASEAPVWLEVSESGVDFHPADHLWTLEPSPTRDRIKDWITENRPGRPESGVVVIGPAGEQPGSFLPKANDCWRSSGSAAINAVMSSKKIKAVAFWGQRNKELAHLDQIRQFNQEISRRSQDYPGMGQACETADLGTCRLQAACLKPEHHPMMPPFQLEGQAAEFSDWEARLIIFDALILCCFYHDFYQWEDLLTILKGVTGSDLDAAGLRKIATAITEEIQYFNLAEGLAPEEDHLHKPLAHTGFPLS
jgi:aldehyde:ferredoxin oxidoreductase